MAYTYQYIPRTDQAHPAPVAAPAPRLPHAHPAPSRARRIFDALVLPGQVLAAAIIGYLCIVAFLAIFGG